MSDIYMQDMPAGDEMGDEQTPATPASENEGTPKEDDSDEA